MDPILSFRDKSREKQLNYERTMLKEISLKEIRKSIIASYGHHFRFGILNRTSIEEGCADFAVEAFLLGAAYSRFGSLGETVEAVNKRCSKEMRALLDEMYEYLQDWGQSGEYSLANESIYMASDHFLHSWWTEGFVRGEKRRKLRLN
ncbi:DUF2521 family protein [Metabacillus sp. RGM 3146]|uniref:DUF2521 family protein n=1 Tax=Metabacillus sp. RGM 3146 TaxID=3401092 RepID=UPI003B9C50A4